MPDIQQLADAMLAAAGSVLGRLVEAPPSIGAAVRHDHEGSIRTDGDELVTIAEIPSVGAQVVVRFQVSDMQRIVGLMLGGSDEMSEMGPMQLSIASETVAHLMAQGVIEYIHLALLNRGRVGAAKIGPAKCGNHQQNSENPECEQ